MPKNIIVPVESADEKALSSYWNYCDSGSNKDYSIKLVQSVDGSGWAVNVAYGRSGGTMIPGCKSGPSPVPYMKALGIYEEEFKKRAGKGYQLNEKALSSYWNYCDSGSNKDYSIKLVQSVDGSGWAVNVAYGRSGGTMIPGCKSGPSPVPYMKALGIYEKEFKTRAGKGYQLQDGGVNPDYVQPPTDKVHAGISPQLLNAVTRDEVNAMMGDPAWGVQEKYDGKRLMVRRASAGAPVEAVNRKGFVVGYPKDVEDVLAARPGRYLLDGEAIGQVFYVFDILEDETRDLRPLPYLERHSLLTSFVEGLGSSVRLVPLARTEDEKRALMARMIGEEREGIVLKRLSAPSMAGRPNSGGNQLKHKLYETASCVVKAVNDKRSVSLVMRRGADTIDVGNVTIPPNYAVPAPGNVVEIRYLYAYEGGSLYQPTYLGVRDDIDAAECVLSQLKYKPEEHALGRAIRVTPATDNELTPATLRTIR